MTFDRTGKRCDRCTFWCAIYVNNPQSTGTCRINPPQVFFYGVRDTAWPITSDNHWCGKFERKREDE